MQRDVTPLADERLVMARTAGGLWLLATVVAIAGGFVPGAEHEHLGVLLVLAVPVLVHAVSCLLGFGWTQVSIGVHAITTALMLPCIGIALWATGGADSWLKPLLMLGALFIGYFQPPRWAWPLTAELILVAALPLYLDPDAAVDGGYVAWLIGFAGSAVAVTFAIERLKRRLVLAERHQHAIAHRDALTGVANRRAFDATLAAAIDRDEPFALLVIDLDDFKGINDTYGHPAGDRVLREVAAHCAAAVRDGDCLARIGGDEFAVIAPLARHEGARRLKAVLVEAVGEVARGEGAAPVRATVSPAVFPDDGLTASELLQNADGALHALKRMQRPVG